MRRPIAVAALFVAFTGLGGVMLTSAGAQSEGSTVSAQARNVRLALHVSGTPAASGGAASVLRMKGVASVTNPVDGVYCITPNVDRIKLNRIVPNVSVDLGTSAEETFNVEAQWRSTPSNCPGDDTIEIDTLRTVTQAGPFNDVGFTVTIP